MITIPRDATDTPTSSSVRAPVPRRGPLLIIALISGLGAAVIYVSALPAELRTSVPFGILFAALGISQLGSAVAVLARPTRERVWLAATAAGAVLVFWALARIFDVLTPDPLLPVNSVIGFTDYLAALLELIAVLILAARPVFGPPPRRTLSGRLLIGLGTLPLGGVVALSIVVGVLAAAGAGFPAGTVPPQNLPDGARSTVEYCRPNGNPLAMDLYMPPSGSPRPAPVALYVHGGGLLFGDRTLTGAGNTLADHEGALFTPLQHELNARGFVVASIDYRLPPATACPAQLDDARCAVTFLRDHAADLGTDSNKLVTWGSSAGGMLVALLGLTDHTGAIRAVVDMFSPADLTDLTGAESTMKLAVTLTFGNTTPARRDGSPITHVHPGAPPFLIMHGTDDPEIPPRQSAILADQLRAANVPTTLVKVQGAGHSLATPGQNPTPQQLTTMVADFITTHTS